MRGSTNEPDWVAQLLAVDYMYWRRRDESLVGSGVPRIPKSRVRDLLNAPFIPLTKGASFARNQLTCIVESRSQSYGAESLAPNDFSFHSNGLCVLSIGLGEILHGPNEPTQHFPWQRASDRGNNHHETFCNSIEVEGPVSEIGKRTK